MKKTTFLSGKIAFPKLFLLNKRILQRGSLIKRVQPVLYEDNGDKYAHVVPEIGECNLAKALLQFELERVRLKSVA